jgi:hypothetical protein
LEPHYNDSSILIDRDTKPTNLASNSLHPPINYDPSIISHIGSSIERQKMNLLTALLSKRKVIRDETVKKLDDLLVYCDNRLLDIGEIFKGDPEKIKMASLWQKEKVAINREIALQDCSQFKDSLFLQNEFLKSVLTFNEEKKIEDLINEIENNHNHKLK